MGSISPLLVSSASPLTPIQKTHGVSSTGTDESYNVKEWGQYLSDCLHYCHYVCVCVCVCACESNNVLKETVYW